jgi:hypothetical protein
LREEEEKELHCSSCSLWRGKERHERERARAMRDVHNITRGWGVCGVHEARECTTRHES